MKFKYKPNKTDKAWQDADYDYLVERAKACLLWNITPEYFDNMTQKEYNAWVEAANEINSEGNDN